MVYSGDDFRSAYQYAALEFALRKPVRSITDAAEIVTVLAGADLVWHMDDDPDDCLGGTALNPLARANANRVADKLRAFFEKLGNDEICEHSLCIVIPNIMDGEYRKGGHGDASEVAPKRFEWIHMVDAQCLIECVFWGVCKALYGDKWEDGIYQFRDRVNVLATFASQCWKHSTIDGELFCDFDAEWCDKWLAMWMEDGLENIEGLRVDRGLIYADRIRQELIKGE